MQPVISAQETSAGSNPQHLGEHSSMSSAVARAYNGGLGAEPPVEPRGKAPGQGSGGTAPNEAKALLFFGHPMETANLSIFLQFGNAKKSDICVIFAKNHGWP